MTVFFRFASPAGPITIKAGIGLTVHPSDIGRVAVADNVKWADGCDYSVDVIEEISSTVEQITGAVCAIAITVTEIEFCEIGSSPIAFRRAAHAAAKSLFDIRPDWIPSNREQVAAGKGLQPSPAL